MRSTERDATVSRALHILGAAGLRPAAYGQLDGAA